MVLARNLDLDEPGFGKRKLYYGEIERINISWKDETKNFVDSPVRPVYGKGKTCTFLIPRVCRSHCLKREFGSWRLNFNQQKRRTLVTQHPTFLKKPFKFSLHTLRPTVSYSGIHPPQTYLLSNYDPYTFHGWTRGKTFNTVFTYSNVKSLIISPMLNDLTSRFF